LHVRVERGEIDCEVKNRTGMPGTTNRNDTQKAQS
jgi:hypothetical protein